MCMTKSGVVVDSSVIVKWLNQTDELHVPQADALLNRARATALIIAAPEEAKFEVGNALLYKHLLPPELAEVITLLYSLPITFYPWHETLARRTAEIAAIYKITYYDACFVNLAESLGVPLITDNPKHQQKVRGAKVIPLKNFR